MSKRKNKKLEQEHGIYYFWDIETSKVPIDQKVDDDINNPFNYLQVPYLSSLLKFDVIEGKEVDHIFHRYIGDFIEYLKVISKNKKVVVYVHNLGYESDFMLRDTGASSLMGEDLDYYGLPISQSIYRKSHDPIKLVLDILPNVIFKDSIALFNKSVEQLGKDLEESGINIKKLDYDYEKVRLPWDKLEKHDYDYNKRDNEVVAWSIYNWIKANKYEEKWDKIPLTFTKHTKNQRREYITSLGKTKREGEKFLRQLTIDKVKEKTDYDFYKLENLCYQGGLTATSYNSVNVLHENVHSADFKSAYPSVMCSKYFPIYLDDTTAILEGEEEETEKILDIIMKHKRNFKNFGFKGFMGIFIFTNLKIKNFKYLNSLNLSHCLYNDNFKIDTLNGKVICADRIIVPATDVFFFSILDCYDFEDVDIDCLAITNKERRLLKYEIFNILHSFKKKEEIDKNKYPVEYKLIKTEINSFYGVKAQKELKNKAIVEDGEVKIIKFEDYSEEDKEWIYENFDVANKESKKKKLKYDESFDLFCHGIYTTDYARSNLIEAMIYLIDNGMEVLYCDTDSLKFTINKKALEQMEISKAKKNISLTYIVSQIIENYNSKIIKRNKNDKYFLEFKERENVSDEVFNKICKLGILEIENKTKTGEIKPYKYFKTLGAKKYIYYHDDKLHTTIAGCSKTVNEHLLKRFKKEGISIKEGIETYFTTGIEFDETVSGRTIGWYDKRTPKECRKLTYKGRPLNSSGGLQIWKTSYTLGMTHNDFKILYGIEKDEEIKKVIGEC